MTQKRLAEFDALIGGYYGKSGGSDIETDPRKRVQDLLSSYYGNSAASTHTRVPQPSVSLSLGCDDGEILSQPPQSAQTRRSGINGAQNAVSLDFEEYVIDVSEADSPSVPDAGPPRAPEAARPPAFQSTPTRTPTPPPARDATPPVSLPVSPDTPVSQSASLTPAEADIVSDIQSIIRGQKVYEKDRGLVDRTTAASNDSSGRGAGYPGVSAQPKNGHEIFDRIAQSMQYANMYDLGSVPLENRFAEFDRQEDQRRRGSKKQTGAAQTGAAQGRPVPQAQPAGIDHVRPTTATSSPIWTQSSRSRTRRSSVGRSTTPGSTCSPGMASMPTCYA